MSRCLELAKNGLGSTYTNPMVGSVLVYNNHIIGEGWHHKAGQPHAEVNAINSVKETDLIKHATIYVSLEPCSHYGKTPPCSDLIIAKGIKKVVIGTIDPFAAVAGRGIKKLLDAGCEVLVGVLEKQCKELNKRFFTFHTKKRPYIILKWAESADGFIAPEASKRTEQKPVWITTKTSRQLVHKWRSEEMSILAGTNTIKQDNPSLTTRDWAGNSPTRILIDRNLLLDPNAQVFDGSAPTLVITEREKTHQPNITFLQADFSQNLIPQICDHLYDQAMQSLIVEGGAHTLQAFIESALWDEARVFKGKNYFKRGIQAPQLTAEKITKHCKTTGDDLIYYTHDND